jgi:hypothetical protein
MGILLFVPIAIDCVSQKIYRDLLCGRQYKQGQQPPVRSASISTASAVTGFILAAAAAATATAATAAVTAATEWLSFLGTGSWQGTPSQSASEYRELWQQQ